MKNMKNMKKMFSMFIISVMTLSIFSVSAKAAECNTVQKGGVYVSVIGCNGNTQINCNDIAQNVGQLICDKLENLIPNLNCPDDNITVVPPQDSVTPPTQDEEVVPPQEDETPDAPQESYELNEFEKEVIRLVNEIRAENGLSALKEDKELSRVARIKSQDMKDNNYFSHTSPTYGSPFEMMKSFGITYKTAGENIAKGQTSPSAVVNGWMNSEGHRKNILNASFNTIGMGYVAEGNYWTQMFIGR